MDLKQASQSWNIHFDQAIKSFGFEQNTDEPCVYNKCKQSMVMFSILYVDDILLIENDVEVLSTIKNLVGELFWYEGLGISHIYFRDQVFMRSLE